MNTLAACATSDWYLTSMGQPAGMVGLRKHGNRIGKAGRMSFTYISPYLPRGPGDGDVTSRLWRGCHSSGVPLPVKLANTPGLPLKSVGAREQVP